MKKSLLIAVLIAGILFADGYILSTIGHNYSGHRHNQPEQPKTSGVHDHSHHEHH